ncbi:MAG: 1-deoxy-D-xylulose-5-phosphate synthase, partial [Muribaculaceae bacterium]|nr:1-deoxy-D-xylulose-5-phosphate synthase [Muribaculaceae bacterium]
RDPTVVAITAGTPAVMGFDAERRAQAGRQFIDMGIAEQDAVSTASGLAKGGARPFFGVYSSFIQRAYDQLSQDVAINGNPAVFGIFAAGVVGMNDVTHLGWFDIPLISNIPNILYLAPTCKEEYLSMLDWAMKQNMQPVAIRVPGGRVVSAPDRTFPTDYSNVTAEVVKEGSKVAIIGVGDFFPMAQKVAEILKESGIDATVINPRYVSGLDKELLENIKKNHSLVITLESGILDGGYGQKIDGFYADCDTVKVLNYGVPKKFLDRYNISELLTELHLSPELIAKDIKDQIK